MINIKEKKKFCVYKNIDYNIIRTNGVGKILKDVVLIKQDINKKDIKKFKNKYIVNSFLSSDCDKISLLYIFSNKKINRKLFVYVINDFFYVDHQYSLLSVKNKIDLLEPLNFYERFLSKFDMDKEIGEYEKLLLRHTDYKLFKALIEKRDIKKIYEIFYYINKDIDKSRMFNSFLVNIIGMSSFLKNYFLLRNKD